MALAGETCVVCKFVLCPDPGLDLGPYTDSYGWITPPEQTLDTFLDAVANKCVICLAVRNAIGGYSATWSNVPAEAWKPMSYKAEGPHLQEPLTRLNVMYRDAWKNNEALDLRFRLIPVENEEYKQHFPPSQADASTSSASTLDLARQWLQSCQSTHSSCERLGKLSSKILPTRLIDIGQHDDTDWSLRIVSEDNVSPTSPYATLSYRWGHEPRLVLLSSNLADLRRPNPIDGLPQTFRDVIRVVRRLGVRYVWIDALCIIQDLISDWEAEAPTMRHVYANSACSIAASACSDPEEDMFRLRDPKDIFPRVVQSSLFAEKPSCHYIFEKGYWDREIHHGPLHNRGWVFQERFLAPRVLYFAKNQVLWECFSEHKCEGFPHGIPAHWSDKSVDPLLEALSASDQGKKSIFVFNMWNDLVKQYSRCNLTRPSDKLFAMAGIAKLFREITGDEYIAGWWRSTLLESLDWRVFEPRSRSEGGYRAPSWSWASVDSPVRTAGVSSSMEILVELVNVQVHANETDLMANIHEATLTLGASYFTSVCHYNDAGNLVLLTERGDLATWLYPDCLDTAFPEGKELVCIIYKRYHYTSQNSQVPQVVCFMTEELSTGGTDAQYRRLGFFFLHEGEQIEKFSTGWLSKEIVLI